MEKKLRNSIYKKMIILSLKDFNKKKCFKNDTMNESELQIYFYCPIHPRSCFIYSVKYI